MTNPQPAEPAPLTDAELAALRDGHHESTMYGRSIVLRLLATIDRLKREAEERGIASMEKLARREAELKATIAARNASIAALEAEREADRQRAAGALFDAAQRAQADDSVWNQLCAERDELRAALDQAKVDHAEAFSVGWQKGSEAAEAALAEARAEADQFRTALRQLKNINNGPDLASPSWRCEEVALIASAALSRAHAGRPPLAECECFGASGLHASTYGVLGSDRRHCDLCGLPVPVGSTDVLTAVNAGPAPAGGTPKSPGDFEIALTMAIEIAVSLHARHYPEVSHWRCDEDLVGALWQISNMVTGLVRAPAGTGGWQPIASAPKDGMSILIFGPWRRPRRTAFWGMASDWNRSYPQERGPGWVVGTQILHQHGPLPTHWMPLPAPPEEPR